MIINYVMDARKIHLKIQNSLIYHKNKRWNNHKNGTVNNVVLKIMIPKHFNANSAKQKKKDNKMKKKNKFKILRFRIYGNVLAKEKIK